MASVEEQEVNNPLPWSKVAPLINLNPSIDYTRSPIQETQRNRRTTTTEVGVVQIWFILFYSIILWLALFMHWIFFIFFLFKSMY
jgi:hypothetical protein